MIGTASFELRIRSLLRRYFPRSAGPDLGYDPYDVEQLQNNAGRLLAAIQHESPRDPAEKCRNILGAIQGSYPTKELAEEYFSTLAMALSDKEKLEAPGQILIGIGPGRCGSTTLSQMLGTIPNSCCTHESPPLIFWRPMQEQVEFHIRRLRVLSRYYSVVSDVSHWWLNALDQVCEQLPETKIIGLLRDSDECAISFMRIQGFGANTFNPWAPRGNNFWRTGSWDATYPSYPKSDFLQESPDQIKFEQILRYVREYNAKMTDLSETQKHRFKMVRTENLSSLESQTEIFSFAKHRGEISMRKVNVKGIRDGRRNQIEI